MSENISTRPRRRWLKAELALRPKPNVNAWLNDLIEWGLAAQPNDWREILSRPRRRATEAAFQQSLKPE